MNTIKCITDGSALISFHGRGSTPQSARRISRRVSKRSVGLRNQQGTSNGEFTHSDRIDPVPRTGSGSQQGASFALSDASQGSPSHGCILRLRSRLTRQGQCATPSHRTASLFRHRVFHCMQSLHWSPLGVIGQCIAICFHLGSSQSHALNPLARRSVPMPNSDGLQNVGCVITIILLCILCDLLFYNAYYF